MEQHQERCKNTELQYEAHKNLIAAPRVLEINQVNAHSPGIHKVTGTPAGKCSKQLLLWSLYGVIPVHNMDSWWSMKISRPKTFYVAVAAVFLLPQCGFIGITCYPKWFLTEKLKMHFMALVILFITCTHDWNHLLKCSKNKI